MASRENQTDIVKLLLADSRVAVSQDVNSEHALFAAAELSARYINDRHLPDKAIDVIDEAGAAQRILPKNKQKKTIGKLEIEDIISKIARIPSQTVNSDDKKVLAKFGQNVVAGESLLASE